MTIYRAPNRISGNIVLKINYSTIIELLLSGAQSPFCVTERFTKPINFSLIAYDQGALDKYQSIPIMRLCLKPEAIDSTSRKEHFEPLLSVEDFARGRLFHP
jgi:hypothetical protein